MELTKTHPIALELERAGCERIGPAPPAFFKDQTNRAIPAAGETMALRVKR
jgi:hypothetical protein